MTNTPINKKKFSEYTFEDLKEIFFNLSRKISSKIILLEIGNEFFNIAVAKLIKNELKITNVFRQDLPKEAMEKSIPADPNAFANLLLGVFKELKLGGERVAIALPSDACYTRIIDIPKRIKEEDSKKFLEDPDSGIQIPISLNNSDFDIHLTNLPEKKIDKELFRRYFLTSIPKKNVNIIIDSIKKSNLELCSIQMSHMCIANLLKSEINKLDDNHLIISVELLDDFTQLIIFDSSGPLFIKRLASIRSFPTISEIKEIKNRKNDENIKSSKKISSDYYPLSKLDLKILIREINNSYKNFLDENLLSNKGKVFLSGRNSQHDNLVEILGESLSMDISLISPIGSPTLREFDYNPDKINQFSMSRIIGLGLSLIRNSNKDNEEVLGLNNFIINKYTFSGSKITSSKKETINPKKDKISPLPDLGINKKEDKQEKLSKKDQEDFYNKNKISDKNKEGFTMDTTFLDID